MVTGLHDKLRDSETEEASHPNSSKLPQLYAQSQFNNTCPHEFVPGDVVPSISTSLCVATTPLKPVVRDKTSCEAQNVLFVVERTFYAIANATLVQNVPTNDGTFFKVSFFFEKRIVRLA